MKEKPREGSQITLPDADPKSGTILCKAIFVKNESDPRVLVEGMRALSKTILNTKQDSVTSDLFSYAGEIFRICLIGTTADKLNRKRSDQDEDFGEV